MEHVVAFSAEYVVDAHILTEVEHVTYSKCAVGPKNDLRIRQMLPQQPYRSILRVLYNPLVAPELPGRSTDPIIRWTAIVAGYV